MPQNPQNTLRTPPTSAHMGGQNGRSRPPRMSEMGGRYRLALVEGEVSRHGERISSGPVPDDL